MMTARPWSCTDRAGRGPGLCLLRATGLHKHFAARHALRGIDLQVNAGEAVGLIGPNGSGKSTLMSIVSGVLRPDAGEVQLGAHGPPSSGRVRRLLGIAPQLTAIYSGLSAEQNLAFFGRLYGLSGRRLRARVDRSLQFVGLADRRADAAGTLSVGMQRRLNLACAIVHEPQLLLLDEPTVGVDPLSRQQLLRNIRQLRNEGHGILYATHHMDEAEQLCDRLVVIRAGTVVAEGSAAELVSAHHGADLEETFLQLTESTVEL